MNYLATNVTKKLDHNTFSTTWIPSGLKAMSVLPPMGFLMLRNEIKYIRKDYICEYIIEIGKNGADSLFY